MTQTLRIATRKSPLALWQARHVAATLGNLHPGLNVDLVPLSTEGDRRLGVSLSKIGGKGLFLKELEHALETGNADIAVHSMKDVPAILPDGMVIAAILDRADPRDAFVSHRYDSLQALPQGAVVGTSSLRRRCQLLSLRPDLKIIALRGNVGSRLDKLERGECDATILAAAGLRRLGLEDKAREWLDPRVCLPAVGQGAIGIECRADDSATRTLLHELDHPDTAVAVRAERALTLGLCGDCTSPIAGFAMPLDGTMRLRGLVGDPEGRTVLRGEATVEHADPEAAGRAVAALLIEKGAATLLQAG